MRTEPEASEIDNPRKLVGVFSGGEPHGLDLLFETLEKVYRVHFEQAERSASKQFDGALLLDAGRLAEAPSGIPRLVLGATAASAAQRTLVTFSGESSLARPLRNATIAEQRSAGESPLPIPDSARLLASTESRPSWWQSGEAPDALCVSAYPPARPAAGESLRDHLRAECFMGLLPLLHFLGLVLDDHSELPRPLQACFVIDDPNLHWPSYGFLRYQSLIDQATEHGYHVALATVPLDGWLINRRSASLIRENPAAISLLMHGNDHVSRELGRLGERDAEPVIAQALRRISALERRSAVAIDRVMAPPHGACSEEALKAMFRLGIEAACISRPYPWLDGRPAPTPLAGWRPAEMVAGGLPILPRYSLSSPREDLAFRALLGQPLILYGHHQDFSDGLDSLAQAAANINSFGDVRWSSVGSIARQNYTASKVGEVLHVEMHSRRISIKVPAGVSALRVKIQQPVAGAAWRELIYADRSNNITFEDGLGVAEIKPVATSANETLLLKAERPLSPTEVAKRALSPWALTRRIMVEGRDRVQPLLPGGRAQKLKATEGV